MYRTLSITKTIAKETLSPSTLPQAGLYEKWAEIMLDDARQESKERQQRDQQQNQEEETAVADTNSGEKPLTIVHLQGPLILLLLGLIFSAFTFTLEVVVVSWFSSRPG